MTLLLGRRSPVLEKLAELYAESEAGKTGCVARDFGEPLPRLLRRAKCMSGSRFSLAETDLLAAEHAGALIIEKNRRSHNWERIRVPITSEATLFAAIGRTSPTIERAAWATLFDDAANWLVPATYQATWLGLCRRRSEQVSAGKGWKPFRREHRSRASAQLWFVSKLLGWNHHCLIRTASAQLSGSSKFFERCTDTLETLLREASGDAIQTLGDLGIESNPTTVRFHGPVRLRFQGVIKDYQGLKGESALSETDITLANAIETEVTRCVTIENATTFYELCRLGCSDLLIFTSYPNQATVDFLRRLPAETPLYHFGDTDPWGFDVLSHLRRKTERRIEPLHMSFRNWAETLPVETRARRPLTPVDRKRLSELLKEPSLADVREELHRMDVTDSTGDFEQEGLLPLSPTFPYVSGSEIFPEFSK